MLASPYWKNMSALQDAVTADTTLSFCTVNVLSIVVLQQGGRVCGLCMCVQMHSPTCVEAGGWHWIFSSITIDLRQSHSLKLELTDPTSELQWAVGIYITKTARFSMKYCLKKIIKMEKWLRKTPQDQFLTPMQPQSQSLSLKLGCA